MGSNVANLNRFRKKKQREERAKQAEINRVRHGRTKAEKERELAERERAARALEGKRLERGDDITRAAATDERGEVNAAAATDESDERRGRDGSLRPMTPEVCRAFARYNRWMNKKVYAAAARLSDEERKRDRGAFFHSIHGVMNHILLADRVWLGRLNGRVAEPGFIGVDGIKTLDQEIASDFDELRRLRDITDEAIDAWVDTVTAESLSGTLRVVRKGAARDFPMWWVVTHVFNHQTHHRGQLTNLLFQAGQDPGVTDIFAMLIEESQSASTNAS